MVDRFGRMPRRSGAEKMPFGTKSCMNNQAPSPAPTPGGNGSCGGCGVSADCKAMMRKLQTIEFTLYDTLLYLDIYPECAEALAYYNKLIEERDALRSTLARKCKRPMTAFEHTSADTWDWTASPWPWDISAN